MVMQSAALALGDILSPPFRAVLLKSVALTLAMMAGLWVVLAWLVA
jgi:CysZ protein